MYQGIFEEIDAFAEFTRTINDVPVPALQEEFDRRLQSICSAAEQRNEWKAPLMQNRVRTRPLGYNGDFLTIVWMYLQRMSDSPMPRFGLASIILSVRQWPYGNARTSSAVPSRRQPAINPSACWILLPAHAATFEMPSRGMRTLCMVRDSIARHGSRRQ